MTNIFCKKCDNPIGEKQEQKITYYHRNKKGAVTCLVCDAERRARFSEISFFVIFGVVTIAVTYFAIYGV